MEPDFIYSYSNLMEAKRLGFMATEYMRVASGKVPISAPPNFPDSASVSACMEDIGKICSQGEKINSAFTSWVMATNKIEDVDSLENFEFFDVFFSYVNEMSKEEYKQNQEMWYAYIFNNSLLSESDVTAEQINEYLDIKIGEHESKLRGMGEAFIKASEETGINVWFLVALAAKQSGWGRVEYRATGEENKYVTENNFFALGATSEGESKYGWDNITTGIIEGSKQVLNGYINNGWNTLGKFGNSGYFGTKEEVFFDTTTANIWLGGMNYAATGNATFLPSFSSTQYSIIKSTNNNYLVHGFSDANGEEKLLCINGKIPSQYLQNAVNTIKTIFPNVNLLTNGSYNDRNISGTNIPSLHSKGLAFDRYTRDFLRVNYNNASGDATVLKWTKETGLQEQNISPYEVYYCTLENTDNIEDIFTGKKPSIRTYRKVEPYTYIPDNLKKYVVIGLDNVIETKNVLNSHPNSDNMHLISLEGTYFDETQIYADNYWKQVPVHKEVNEYTDCEAHHLQWSWDSYMNLTKDSDILDNNTEDEFIDVSDMLQ